MSKETLKETIKGIKGDNCSISIMPLPEDYSLYDTHRQEHKKDGGIYTIENTNLAIPVGHMKEHGTYRERSEDMDQLKSMIDDRNQIMKQKNSTNNRLLAFQRETDYPNQRTIDFLTDQLKPIQKELARHDRDIAKQVKTMKNPLADAALSVPSIGPITVAHCLAYIDLEKARHASSLWAYVGLDKPSHARYEKGTAGGGNKTLRTVLYTMADSQIKGRGPYREVYDNTKARLEQSQKIVKTRNTQGKLVELPWSETKPCHRHGAAIRVIMKHFLADYWMVGRTLAGLPTSALYPEAMLGGTHRTIMPRERGWAY